jgi:hypothetical protein
MHICIHSLKSSGKSCEGARIGIHMLVQAPEGLCASRQHAPGKGKHRGNIDARIGEGRLGEARRVRP